VTRFIATTAVLLTVSPVLAQDAQLTPPKLTKYVEAVVPIGTRSRDLDVVVLVTIDEKGAVSDVTIKTGAGEPWDSAAIAAVKQFGFEPAREGEKAIAVQVPYVYRFFSKRRGRFVARRRGRRALHPTPGYRLAGEILEKGTRAPLVAIPIVITDPSTGRKVEVTTGPDGRFVAYGLAPGQLELSIVTGEHKAVGKAVKGVPGDPNDAPIEPSVQLYLDPVGFSQYRTVIKDKPKAKAATEIHLTEEELRKVPGTFGDPSRVPATLPGVARSPFGLGYYVVRGASFENTGFFIDGHPSLFLYHLLGGPGVVHPELIGSLTFYPGGYPANFGRFATGAILLDTKDPPDDRWHGDVSIDLLKASALFSVPFDEKKGMVTAAVRRSYYELFLPLVAEGTSLSYTDYQLRVTWNPTPQTRLKFLALGAEDRVGSEGDPEEPDEERNSDLALGFHRLLFSADFDVTPKVTLENSVVWEYDHTSSQQTSEENDDIDVGFGGYFFSIRSGAVYKPNKRFKLQGGLDALIADVDADLQVPSFPPLSDPRPPIFNPIIINQSLADQFYSIALYAAADWDVGGGVRIIPGVRGLMDHYSGEARWNADPRLAVRWQVHDQWTLTGMGAIVNQIPPGFQTNEEFGDPSIDPVRGTQGSFGVEWEPGDGWEIKLEGFYNFLDNMARPSGAALTDDGGFDRALWTADMKGRAYGAELLVRKRFGGRVHGWLAYTLSRAERLRPPADWDTYEIDQTHILNLAWTVQLGADWSASARFQLTSGNPFYPVTGSRYDADRDRYEPVYAEERDRLPFFHRLDIRIDKRWRFDTWMLEAYLDIQNVYNATNPEVQRYSFDYSIQSAGLSVPILPTLGLRAVF